jgi:HK97 family phage major capsid protein
MPDGGVLTLEDIRPIKAQIEGVSQEVQQFATDILGKVEKGQRVTDELKAQVDKALTEANEQRTAIIDKLVAEMTAARAQIQDLEQKAVRRPGGSGGDADAYMTPGQRFITDERIKAVLTDPDRQRWRGRVRANMAAITTVTAGATRDVLVPADRRSGIIERPNRRMTIRDLLTPGRTTSNAIEYVREVGFSNAAAVVSEGDLKPESDIDYELKLAPVATIAHFIVASKQILDDAPQLETSIDGRLRYGLAFVEEQQLLNGDGTGANLNGIVTQATAFSRTFVPELPTRIDDIRLAILQTELAEFPATGVVLHPTDWARIEMAKDTQGKYLITSSDDGQGNATVRLWGLPVVPTQAMLVTKFLVGAFMLGAQIFDREDAMVEISTEDSDNFRRNLATLRGEERLALAVYRPESFIYGTFQTGT